MNKKLLFFLAIILSYSILNSQNLINWYADDFNSYDPTNFYLDGNSEYLGEYMLITSKRHSGSQVKETQEDHANHWYDISLDQQPSTNGFGFSFRIEAISFPFVPDHLATLASNNTMRHLGLPNSQTSSTNYLSYWDWDHNCRVLNWREGYTAFTIPSATQGASPIITGWTLITKEFRHPRNSDPCLTLNIDYLPHTVLRHTLYISCLDKITDARPSNAFDSISWIVDHTRGAMSEYPFIDKNYIGHSASEREYDVQLNVSFPILKENIALSQSPQFKYQPTRYESSPTNPRKCGEQSCQLGQTVMHDSGPYFTTYPCPNYFTSFILTDASALAPAGYSRDYVGAFPDGYYEFRKLKRMPHSYELDQNFDVSLIGKSGLMHLYNPSRVSITASNFVFPTYFHFKTIRGTHASIDEVNLANTVENGGPFMDHRKVPVPTDLSIDPNDPTKASKYTIESGASLTLEPCIGIWDATIEIMSGGNLTFTPSRTMGRYDIVKNGGNVTLHENYFLIQNKVIDEYENLEGQEIKAGRAIDPTQMIGNVSVEADAREVKWKAKNKIILKPGFFAKSGTHFEAKIEFIPLINCSMSKLIQNL